MNCHACGDPRFRVTNTEHREDGTYRWRRCRACNYLLRFREVPAPTKPGPLPGTRRLGARASGSRNAASVLTEDDVRRLRAQSTEGVPNYRLAKEYGIAPETVSRIVNRKAWTHI